MARRYPNINGGIEEGVRGAAAIKVAEFGALSAPETETLIKRDGLLPL